MGKFTDYLPDWLQNPQNSLTKPNPTLMKHCISQVNQVTIQYFMNTQTIMTKQRTGHDSVFPGLGFSQVMENWKGHGILLCIFSGLESNEKLLDLL